MKKTIFALCILMLSLSFFAKIGGVSARQGTITSLDRKGKLYLATVRMEAADSSEAVDPSQKVKQGMSARIIYSIGGAQFRLPFGRVLNIEKNGNVIVSIDELLLDKEISDPNSDEKIKVGDLLTIGAEVSISTESI